MKNDRSRSAAETVLAGAVAHLASRGQDVEVSMHAYDGDTAAVLLGEPPMRR